MAYVAAFALATGSETREIVAATASDRNSPNHGPQFYFLYCYNPLYVLLHVWNPWDGSFPGK